MEVKLWQTGIMLHNTLQHKNISKKPYADRWRNIYVKSNNGLWILTGDD